MKWIVFLPCILLLFPSLAASQVLLNEVYYDHPGSDSGHEFIELMNVSMAPVLLSGYEIEFHDGASGTWKRIWSAAAADTVGAGALFVVGGDNVYPAPDALDALGLQNGPDAVRLLRDGLVVDVLGYGELDDPSAFESVSAPDVKEGQSLARTPDGIDTDNNARDFVPSAPSPGGFNVPRRDLRIERGNTTQEHRVIEPGASERFGIRIVNDGTLEVASSVDIVVTDSMHAGPVTADSLRVHIALAPGAAQSMDVDVLPAEGYHDVVVHLKWGDDERPSSNVVRLYRRVGGPRIIVSEVMSHPAEDCPEYVELLNTDAVAHDLAGYLMRDAVRDPSLVRSEPFTVGPGAYAVLTPDKSALERCFPDAPSSSVVEVEGTWPSLNHSGSGEADSVIVLDFMRLPVDRVAYPGQSSNSRGRSLERIDLYPGVREHTWVLSDAPAGGTPGHAHAKALTQPGAGGAVTAEPNPFDPYAAEQMLVSIGGAASQRASASVFDVGGRRIAMVGTAVALPHVFVWDGRDDDGELVTPGVYVLACEFADDSGRQNVAKVVIACARRR